MAKTSITPAQHDFEIWQGDTFTQSVAYTDALNQPVDLTTATVKMQIRDTANALIFELNNTVGGGITISNNVLSILKNFTQNQLAAGTHKYDLEINFASGIRRTILQGAFIVLADVTE